MVASINGKSKTSKIFTEYQNEAACKILYRETDTWSGNEIINFIRVLAVHFKNVVFDINEEQFLKM